MVKIPKEVKLLLESQGIFAVGSVGGDKFANVSPRIFFEVKDDVIYWLDFFHHKSYKNFKINPWVTIAVYDKNNLTGFQLRGTVSFITNEPTKSEIRNNIINKIKPQTTSNKVKTLCERQCEVILFEPKVIYSLNPEKFSDLSIGSDIDSEQIYK